MIPLKVTKFVSFFSMRK